MSAKYVANITPWEISETDFPSGESTEEKIRFLLGYAILAPSSHNSQPWKFLIQDDTVLIFTDNNQWLKVADADQREMHISVGCALENLLIAAEHFGYGHAVEYFPEGDTAQWQAFN
jgi:nitroreductase